uniref:Uncharacterized protein n=1 Tax=Setaria italica TaxID=4555 RepID=K3XUJ3_SETIT
MIAVRWSPQTACHAAKNAFSTVRRTEGNQKCKKRHDCSRSKRFNSINGVRAVTCASSLLPSPCAWKLRTL